MRWCRWVLPVMVAAALSGQASSEVVVREWSGHYQRGVHYDVIPPSIITIYVYHAGFVYDFEAYDNSTPPPYGPATIQAIVPGGGFTGIVELKVVGHEDREYGAENVDQIFFDYDQGKRAVIKAFKIHGTLGTVAGTENRVFSIEGDFSAASIARPFRVFAGLLANVTVTGDVPEAALLQIGKLDDPYAITIGGNLLGDLIFHNDV